MPQVWGVACGGWQWAARISVSLIASDRTAAGRLGVGMGVGRMGVWGGGVSGGDGCVGCGAFLAHTPCTTYTHHLHTPLATHHLQQHTTPLPLPKKKQPVQPPAERALQEQPWKLTQADGLQVAASVGLGVMNFVGVVALTQLLQDPTARFALANSGLAFMGGLLPYLAVCWGWVCGVLCVVFSMRFGVHSGAYHCTTLYASICGIHPLVVSETTPTAHTLTHTHSLTLVHSVYPLLPQAYAVAFFAIPAIRWFQNTVRNAGIARRNNARMSYLQELANPPPSLKAKLMAARQLATTTRVDDRNVVFRTDRDAGQQAVVNEFDEFDRKLGKSRGEAEEDDWRGQVLRRSQKSPR